MWDYGFQFSYSILKQNKSAEFVHIFRVALTRAARRGREEGGGREKREEEGKKAEKMKKKQEGLGERRLNAYGITAQNI